MIFSGSVVVDWHNSSGFCEAQAGRSLVPGRRLHRAWPRPADAEPRLQQRPRPDVDEVRRNPVIDLGLKDFRDPKVFWHEPTRRWIMVTVLPDQHKVRFFASPDLKSWDAPERLRPGGRHGRRVGMPRPLPAADRRTNRAETRWVLEVDINPGGIAGGSGGQYFVGTFDGSRFVADEPPDRTLWADYGKDFYASLSFSDVPASDGRRIWMGWISNWQYANVEPTDDVARRAVGPAHARRSAGLPTACAWRRRRWPSSRPCARRHSRVPSPATPRSRRPPRSSSR